MPQIDRASFASVLLLMAFGEACRLQPNLTPRLIVESEHVGREFWLGAPYVAAVKIIRADMQGGRQSMFQGGPKSLQLVKFDARIENTIRGELPTETISFYFFAYLDQKHDYYLHPGKRYVISLRSEGGVLRSLADGTQLAIEVYSGTHNQQDLPLNLGPEAAIAYIRLTPGVDLDLDNFKHHLDGTWAPSDGSPKYVYERLRALLKYPDPTVGDEACIAMEVMVGQRPNCLDRAAHSVDAAVRDRANRLLERDDSNLLRQLRNDPSSLLPEPWMGYVPDMLEIYAEDTRPEIRKAACESLRRFAPQQSIESCR